MSPKSDAAHPKCRCRGRMLGIYSMVMNPQTDGAITMIPNAIGPWSAANHHNMMYNVHMRKFQSHQVARSRRGV